MGARVAGGIGSVDWEGVQFDELGSFCPSTVRKERVRPAVEECVIQHMRSETRRTI